jgi:hypothetical protein
MDATINGLMDGVSVLETNKDEQPSIASDILYNNQEIDFDQFYNDGEYVYPNFDYQSMYMDAVSILSMPDEQTVTI